MERRKCYCGNTYVAYKGTPKSGSCGAPACTPPVDHVPDVPVHRPQHDTTEKPTPQRATDDF